LVVAGQTERAAVLPIDEVIKLRDGALNLAAGDVRGARVGMGRF
jgi:hypothetical protein